MNKLISNLKYPVLIAGILLSPGCLGQKQSVSDGRTGTVQNSWKVIGPGGGGGVLKPTISPFNPNFVLAHCDMTGTYVTTNGGMSWKMKNLWNVPDDFEFDPSDSSTVYVATRGFLHSEDRGSGISLLLRSSDKGETFTIIYPDVKKSKKIERLQSTGSKPSDLIEGALDGTIQKVKVDPSDNSRIFFGMSPLIDYLGRGATKSENENATLVLSEDHGSTWRTISALSGKNVLAIILPPAKDIVITFTESTCQRMNLKTGSKEILPLPVSKINAVAGGKGRNGSLIYVVSDFRTSGSGGKGGAYLSRDLGLNWTQINNGLMENTAKGKVPAFRDGFAVCESVPEVAYISLVNPVSRSGGEIVDIYSIYKTIDAGVNWKPVLLSSTPDGYITKNFEGSWMEKSFDPGWGGNPIDLGVAPGNPDLCFAGDNGRGYKTSDGGKTWKQVYSHNNPDGSYSSSGLDVTTCYGVHFDPFDREHFFICYTDMGLFHTFNGGKSWYHAITGIPGEWVNTCYQVAFDPEIKGKVWSVWANAHDLPRTKMFGGDGFDDFSGGVALSEDSGRTWVRSSSGMSENSVCTNILIDPASPVNSRVLYVSMMGKGISKSTDGGKTWILANKGLGDNLFAWELRRNARGRIFALFARGLMGGNTIDGTIYYSDNGAESWVKVTLPAGVNGPHDLLIDPVHPEVMYLSCWPHAADGTDRDGGVLKTEDGGLTWKLVFDDRVRVNSAGMDKAVPGIIYINTFQNAAYRSTDAGTSWKRIEGYRFKWGQKAIPDVNNPGMLFLSTYGGSVFYGPAGGVPGIKDDITNMPDGWW